MGLVTEENEMCISLAGAMDISVDDKGHAIEMLMQPTIPFGIDQNITIQKQNILFTVYPNDILESYYLDKTSESISILKTVISQMRARKKEQEKHLH